MQLFIFIIMAMAVASASLTLFGSRLTRFVSEQSTLQHQSEINTGQFSIAESVKAEFKTVMRENGLNSQGLRAQISTALSGTGANWAEKLVTAHQLKNQPPEIEVRTVGVSSNAAVPANHYADVEVSQYPPNHPDQKKKRKIRIQLGQTALFSNAMTGNSYQCVFCHAHVYGDIGEYANHEAPYFEASRFHGTWRTHGKDLPTDFPLSYPAYFREVITAPGPKLTLKDQSVTPDVWGYSAPPAPLTAMARTHFVKGFESNYDGPKLPWNFQKQTYSLPKFNPDSMLTLARGTLSGGSRYRVAYGANGAVVSPTTMGSPIQGYYSGNLILDGRATPLVISGRVYVRGDIVILGQIQGQGELYSGRNIYIPDDLTYVNSPPQFDGTEASNTIMSGVSTNAAALAAAMSSYDQLALFAVNHIVITDPFHEEHLWQGQYKLAHINSKFISEVFLSSFLLGKIALDKQTGTMLDAELGGGGTMLWSLPWAKKGDYLAASRVLEIPANTYSSPAAAPSDKAYYMDYSKITQSAAYQELFLPRNMVSGSQIAWITAANFRQYTNNAAEIADNSSFLPAAPLRKKYRFFSLPLFLNHPADPQKWKLGWDAETPGFTEGALRTLDDTIGLISEAGALNVQLNPPVGPPPPTPTLQDTITDFLNRFVPVVIGDGTPNKPIQGMSGADRNTLGFPVVMKINGVAQTSDILLIVGGLTYYSSNQKSYMGIAVGSHTASSNFCYDNEVTVAGYDSPVGSCRPNNWLSSGRENHGGDLNIRLLYYKHANSATSVNAYITTRYWDPAKVLPRNTLRKIEAFLFANQLIAIPSDSMHDTQLRIHGGMVAKDIAARLVNRVGTNAQGFASYEFDHATVAGPLMQLAVLNELPSLIVVLDPRAQFSLDLLSSSFGSAEDLR